MGKRTLVLATVLLASVSAGAAAQSLGPASDGFAGRWLAPECGPGVTIDADGEPQHFRDIRCEGHVASSDLRFGGTYVSVFNLDTYRGEAFAPDEGAFNVWTIVRRVENDEGAWQGKATTAVWVDDPEAWFIDDPPATVVFSGEGGYEGLTAIVTIGERVVNSAFRGYIFAGSAPPEPSITE